MKTYYEESAEMFNTEMESDFLRESECEVGMDDKLREAISRCEKADYELN